MKISKSSAQEVLNMIQRKKLSWHQVQTVFAYLKALLIKAKGDEYIYWLKYLARLMSLGYGELVAKDGQVQRRLVEMFTMSFKQLTMEPTSTNFSYTIFQITVIADLVRISPKTMYPYNHEFIEATIKLSQFTSLNKESEEKISLRIFIVYFSFTDHPELYESPHLLDTFQKHLIAQICQSQKYSKYQHYDILTHTLENLVSKIPEKNGRQCGIDIKQDFDMEIE